MPFSIRERDIKFAQYFLTEVWKNRFRDQLWLVAIIVLAYFLGNTTKAHGKAKDGRRYTIQVHLIKVWVEVHGKIGPKFLLARTRWVCYTNKVFTLRVMCILFIPWNHLQSKMPWPQLARDGPKHQQWVPWALENASKFHRKAFCFFWRSHTKYTYS